MLVRIKKLCKKEDGSLKDQFKILYLEIVAIEVNVETLNKNYKVLNKLWKKIKHVDR